MAAEAVAVAVAVAVGGLRLAWSSSTVAVSRILSWFASVWSISDDEADSSLQCEICACTSRSDRLASSCERRKQYGSAQVAGARVCALPRHLHQREGVFF